METTFGYEPYHEVQNETFFQELCASLLTDGWKGAPLVADGTFLITGSHRYAACCESEVLPQVIDIREIVPNWDEILEDWDNPAWGEGMYAQATGDIPQEIRNAYGIDIW